MALTVTSASNPAPARPESRGEAIARVVREREAQASSSSTPEPQGQARAAVAAGSASGAVPQAAEQAPAAAPAAAPNHEHLVEIERRERALESARHEGELAKRELAALREKQAELKDWRKALAAGGHNIEDIVQEWLGGDSKPTDKAPAPAPKGEHSGLSPDLIARLEKLESKELEEQRGRARLAKRQSILDLMPEGSEDFEATRNMGDGAIDMFLNYLESEEKRRPEGIGPQETAKLLRDFEGATRKNLENDFSRLAKSKWARQAMQKLLESASASDTGTAAPESVSQGHEKTDRGQAPNGSTQGIRPVGLSTEEIKQKARAALIAKWR